MNQEYINCATIPSKRQNESLMTVEELFGFLDCPTNIECMIGGLSIDRLPPGSTHTAISSVISVLSPNCEHINIHDITSKMIRDFVDKQLGQKYGYRGVITIDDLKRSIEYGKDVPCIFQFLSDYFETHILVYRNNQVEAYYNGTDGSPFRKVIILHEIVTNNEVAICYQTENMRKVFDILDVKHIIEMSVTPSLRYKITKNGIKIPVKVFY